MARPERRQNRYKFAFRRLRSQMQAAHPHTNPKLLLVAMRFHSYEALRVRLSLRERIEVRVDCCTRMELFRKAGRVAPREHELSIVRSCARLRVSRFGIRSVEFRATRPAELPLVRRRVAHECVR